MAATWPLQRECDAFYGNPRGANGKGSAKWESANLTMVPCPWVLRYDGRPVKGLNVHKKVAASLKRVLAAIWERLDHSQAEIDRIGMSIYGGAYNFRIMRGGSALSMHSWGCAIDFDPARNGFGDKTPAMDRRVIEEFEREGWEWGGHWSRPDGMHFQAAWTRAKPPRLKSAVASLMATPEPDELEGPTSKPDDAPAPAPTPVVSSGDEVRGDPSVWQMQRRLKAMNYSPGNIDGLWGGLTAGAISGFVNDRQLATAVPTSLDMFREAHADLVAAIDQAEAEGWTRPIAKERADATPAQVAAKVGSVEASQMSKLWSWVLGIPAGITAVVKGVVDNFDEALQSPFLNAAKEFFADNVLGIALVVVGIAGAIWWSSRRAETTTIKAYQEGRLT